MFDHLKDFITVEGHWDDYEIYQPIVLEMFNKHKVKSILEIGFNIGHSSSLFLATDPDQKCHVTSVDVARHKDTKAAAEAVKSLYPDRFSFIISDSRKVLPQIRSSMFDLIFIDGDHSTLLVQNDISLGLHLKIPFMLFDDWHFPGVRKGCDIYQNSGKIKLHEVYNLRRDGRVALYKNDSIHPTQNLLKRQVQLLSPKRD